MQELAAEPQQTDIAPPTTINPPEQSGSLEKQPVQAEPPTPQTTTPDKQKFNVKLVSMLVIAGIILITAIGGGYAYYRQQQIQSLSESAIVESVIELPKVTPDLMKPTSTPSVMIESVIYPMQDVTINWLDEPKPVAIPDMFVPYVVAQDSSRQIYITDEAKFYKIADLSDGSSLLNGYLEVDGPGFYVALFRIIETKDGSFFVIEDNLRESAKTELAKQLLPEAKFATVQISALYPPETISGDGIEFKRSSSDGELFSEQKNPQKIATTEYGDIYKTYTPIFDSKEVFDRKIFLKLPDQTIVNYYLPDEVTSDDLVALLTWSDNTKNTTTFTQRIVLGCGSGVGGDPVIKNTSSVAQDLRVVGVLEKNKESVYQTSSSNNELVSSLYSNYADSRGGYEGAPEVLSQTDFAKAKSYFLWKDQFDDLQIFSSNEFGTLAECGKPVIYLYPEEKTQVSVQVGATITKSDPTYPEKGWQVIAQPDGSLTYQNQSYPYLFWEGLGKGIYPDYRDQGVVISREKLVETLTSQLNSLGLTEKESADFMEFWQPRLPKTPFTRLTWLGTPAMNELAPLSISPKPDTLIRIFLEFEGLKYQKELIPQRLSSVKREGFTVVEWGGLLMGE